MQPEQDLKPTVQETVPANQEPNAPVDQEAPPKSSKDWDKFRENRAAERKQAEELAKQRDKATKEAEALRAALDSVLNKPTHQPQQDYYGNAGEDEEARIERKVQEAIARREAEAHKKRQEEERNQLPQLLARNHPDFNQVCSTENIDYLEYHHPEIAKAFEHMPEGYDKWSCVYRAVKKFVPNTQSDDMVRKAERNLNKPQSVSSPTVSQNAQGSLPVVLDEARKKANYERMQKVINSIG